MTVLFQLTAWIDGHSIPFYNFVFYFWTQFQIFQGLKIMIIIGSVCVLFSQFHKLCKFLIQMETGV